MLRLIILLVLMPATVLGQGSTEPPEKPKSTLRVCGLQVVGKGYGDPNKFGSSLRPFNWWSGTRIAVIATLPGSRIVAFDDRAGKIDELVDDKETDLGTKAAGARPFGNKNTRFGMSPRISKDGKAVLFEIESPKLPGKGATTITAKGEIVMWVGSKTKDHANAGVEVKTGAEIKAGEIVFKVSKIRLRGAKWEDGVTITLSYTLKETTGLSPIADVKFAAGKTAVEATRWGSSTMGTELTVSYRLKKPPADRKLDITVSLWEDLAKKSMPFDLKVSLGLD